MVFYYTGFETDVDLAPIAAYYKAKIINYIGQDSHGRPVYQDADGNLYKDTDPRAHKEPRIFTVYGGFEGEPDSPVNGNVVLSPKRFTW